MVTEEMQVVREAQDNTRSYEELKALREIAVFWQQKKILQSDPQGSPAAVVTPTETAAEEQTSPTLQRWFPLWGGWYDAENRGEELEQPPEI